MEIHPLQRIEVPLAGLAVHEGLRHAEEIAAERFGRLRHRRLGYKVSDAILTAWYGQVVV